MDRGTRKLFLAALAVVVVAVAMAAYVSQGNSGGRPPGPTVDGVVIQVESTGLTSVSGFTLLTADGRQLRFGLAELRNGTAFPPGHLPEHVATAAPVRVWYREAGALAGGRTR
jgi:hypothetical protein